MSASTSYKTPVSKGRKKPPSSVNASISLIISPPLHESTKLESLKKAAPSKESDSSTSPSENVKKTGSGKPKRVRRNYEKFKVGHEVDKKEGWVDEKGRLLTVKDKIDALFKPKSNNCDTPKDTTIPESPSTSPSSEEAVAELPPDPRYPVLLQSSLTTRDIYDAQRLVTRLNLVKEDFDKMVKETSPRIEQKIKDIGERKKQIMEMAKERLERIDRDIERHKFPSATDISGERRTDLTLNSNSFLSRPSFGDFVNEGRKRSLEEPNIEVQTKAQKSAAIKRRRTIASNLSSLAAPSVSSDSHRSRGVLVTTSLHEDEQLFVQDAVKKLGGFQITDDVTRTTTHLVCGAQRRTLNVLRAIGRGCWIVSTEWVSASLDAGYWLPEEEFEAVAYFPNCRGPRLTRQERNSKEIDLGSRRKKKAADDDDSEKFGLSEILPILHGCGGIYVAEDIAKPKVKDVHELVRLCAGKLVPVPSARIIIANKGSESKFRSASSSSQIVTSNWLLDSIMATQVLSTEEYLVSSRRSPET